jgi:hypothetical protein
MGFPRTDGVRDAHRRVAETLMNYKETEVRALSVLRRLNGK